MEAKPEWVDRMGSRVQREPETAEPRSQPGKEETGQEDRVRVSVYTCVRVSRKGAAGMCGSAGGEQVIPRESELPRDEGLGQ